MKETEATVTEFLSAYRGKRVYRVPMVDASGTDFGNNGDGLIERGGEKLMAGCGLEFVSSPSDADLLLIRGNGAMVRGYTLARKVLQQAWANYPNTPLLMLPATFHYPDQNFTDDLGERSAPVTLFCREQFSYRHLTQEHRLPDYCSVGIGHDTAFELRDDPIVTDYQQLEPKQILICERGDREHPTNHRSFWDQATSPTAIPLRSKITSRIPLFLKKPLYPLKAMLQGRKQSVFRTYCENVIQRDWSQYASLPRYCRDVSDKSIGDFKHFCQRIAEAAVVFSTRLHVGIYAAMLGKPTYIFEGPYHKIRAIYEHSMTEFPHVNFVSRDQLQKSA